MDVANKLDAAGVLERMFATYYSISLLLLIQQVC